jgi:hypothetical protein
MILFTSTIGLEGVAGIGNIVKCSEAIEKQKKVIIFYGYNFYATLTLLNVFSSVDLLESLER